MLVRQLFGPNLGIFQGEQPHKMKPLNCLTKKVETHNVGSCM